MKKMKKIKFKYIFSLNNKLNLKLNSFISLKRTFKIKFKMKK